MIRKRCRDAWQFAAYAHQPFWLTFIYVFLYGLCNGLWPPESILGFVLRVGVYGLVLTFSISRWTLTHDRPDYGMRKRDRG